MDENNHKIIKINQNGRCFRNILSNPYDIIVISTYLSSSSFSSFFSFFSPLQLISVSISVCWSSCIFYSLSLILIFYSLSLSLSHSLNLYFKYIDDVSHIWVLLHDNSRLDGYPILSHVMHLHLWEIKYKINCVRWGKWEMGGMRNRRNEIGSEDGERKKRERER